MNNQQLQQEQKLKEEKILAIKEGFEEGLVKALEDLDEEEKTYKKNIKNKKRSDR